MNPEPKSDTSHGSVSGAGIGGGIVLLFIAACCDTVTMATQRYLVPLVIAIATASLAMALFGINYNRSGILFRCILAFLLLVSLVIVADAAARLVWLWALGKL